MSVARHPRPKELEGVPLEEIMKKYVGRFKDKKPDWAAFEDAKIEGFKRAQHRFIGAGGSGKHGDPSVIPTLRQTLKDPDVNMRGWSIIGLGNLKDEDSILDLQDIALDSTQPDSIRAAAVRSVHEIKGTTSEQASP